MFFIFYAYGFIYTLVICETLSKASCQIPSNFPSDIPLRKMTYENWSNELKISNLWVATPSSSGDVVRLANWAYVNGFKLRASGFMHNWSPLTVTKDTNNQHVVLVDTTKNLVNIEMTISPNPSTRAVKVQAGATMQDLLTFLEGNGLGLHSCTACGDVSVGGVLAIGGHGTVIPAVEEISATDQPYGTLSNLVIRLTAVVWDSIKNEYILRTFQRFEPDTKAFLVHLGRAFIIEVTLMVDSNYDLRCVSRIDISSDELFADPTVANTRSYASLLDLTGRVEIISFPFTNYPWTKIWSVSPNKSPLSTSVLTPYNYAFTDTIPKRIALWYGNIAKVSWILTPILNTIYYFIAKVGLLATLSSDIWGKSKNVLLYVKPTTLRMTEHSHAIITSRGKIQKVVSTIMAYYNYVLYQYAKDLKYPFNGPVQIRTTNLDQPGVVPGGESPTFSPAHPVPNHPEFNVAVWFTILSIPETPYVNNAMANIESFLYSTFNGTDAIVRPEWSKLWACTDSSPWSNATIYKAIVPFTFPKIEGWNWGVATLNKYDPHRIFTNTFLDKLLVTV